MKIGAAIIWVCGLIVAIVNANVTTYSSYGLSYTDFSFSTFLIYLLAFGFAGWVEYQWAIIIEAISDTRDMVEGLALSSIESENSNVPNTRRIPAPHDSASEENARKKEEKAARLNAYWESHAEEKDQLESEKSEIKQQIGSLISQKTKLTDDEQSQIRAISQKSDNKALDEKNSSYEAELNSLGRFNGKRKDELADAMTLVLEERLKLETKYKKEIRENSQAQITKINEQIHQIQVRISQIDTELTKDR